MTQMKHFEAPNEEQYITALESQIISHESLQQLFSFIYQHHKLYPNKPILNKDILDNLINLDYHNMWERINTFIRCKFLKKNVGGHRISYVLINPEWWDYIHNRRFKQGESKAKN